MYKADYMDRARTHAGAYIHSATKRDVHVRAKKGAATKTRAPKALAATRRLLRTPGALPIVEELKSWAARKKRRWPPDGARQRAH